MPWVHVYCARPPRAHASALRRLACDDDRAAAGAISGSAQREQFLTGRAFLRDVLSRHARCPSAGLEFSLTRFGKPFLGASPRVHFNLSHSNGIYIAAVAEAEVGVDVELIDRDIDHRSVGQEVFSGPEIAFLDEAPADRLAQRFFSVWTRKEAYLKATGLGFSSDLRAISVVSSNGAVADMSRAEGAPNWYSREIDVGWDARAAIAIAGRAPVVLLHDCATWRQPAAAQPSMPLKIQACAETR